MGKHISVTPLKFLMALLLWIFFLAYSCSNRVKSYIDSNQIVGCWHLEDESGALCYNQLTFNKDSTAIVDNKIDTLMYFRYKIINDTLYLRDIDNRITIGVINSLDSCELLFDNFREKSIKWNILGLKWILKIWTALLLKNLSPIENSKKI